MRKEKRKHTRQQSTTDIQDTQTSLDKWKFRVHAGRQQTIAT